MIALLRDPIIRLALVVVAFGAAPVIVPILSAQPVWSLAVWSTSIPLIVVAILAFEHGLGRVEIPNERRFWHLWAIGFGFWLAVEIFGLVAGPAGSASVGLEVVRTGLTFFYYFCLAAAIEGRPHGGSDRARRLRSLERVGAFVFIAGQLVYFAVAPGVLDIAAYWRSSLALNVVLDAYLVYRLVGSWRDTGDPVWRRSYLWLAVTTALWLASNAIQLAIRSGLVEQAQLEGAAAGPLDLLWIPALLTAIVAARSRFLPTASGRSRDEDRAIPVVGPLVVYAVAFPLIHFLFSRLSIAQSDLRPIREVVALVFLVTLALLGAAYQALLRRENLRLDDERREAMAKIEHQAYHDALTGLPNRLLFNDHLSLALVQARRHERRVAVLFLDLDEFKVVNDSRGHLVGDDLLIAVARRLRRVVREGDTVARIGGDEFIVLLEDLRGTTDGARVATNILEAIREPFVIQAREHHMTASVGVALFPEDGDDEMTLIKNADLAMYQAKRAGRDMYRLFTEELNRAAVERLALESDLRKGMERGELFQVFQPIVDLKTRRIVGAEALLRWRHPERGVLGPFAFIDLAEATGLIVPMGWQSLEESCRQLARWRAEGRELFVAANLSARQLQEPGFAAGLAKLIRETGIDPRHLEVEITESMAIEREAEIVDELQQVRDLGVRVSLDDFGTRHSSLARLRSLPIDVLKIDRSFVREVHEDPRSVAIIRAIVEMARALSLEVIVEGVELVEQLRIVSEGGCDLCQGYYFARPIEAAEFEALYDRDEPLGEAAPTAPST